jgi:hypothetical protein
LSNTSATGGYLTPSPLTTQVATDFRTAFNHLIRGVTGIPGSLVRPRWQSEPLPIPASSEDWVAFGVLRSDGEGGSPYVEHIPDGDGYDEAKSTSFLQVLVTAYGPNSDRTVEVLRVGLTVSQNWEELLPLGINLSEIGDSTALPELINNEWYLRADLPVTLKRSVTARYPILNVLSASGVFSGNRPVSDTVVQQDFDTERAA